MINQKTRIKKIIIQLILQKKEAFKYLIFVFTILIFSCNETKIKTIRSDKFDMEGEFLNDSIPSGQIKYYIAGTNDLVFSKEFKNGILNGVSINYFGKKIIQIVNYKNNFESGFSEVFDSISGSLINKEFYYYGKKIGPAYEYKNGILLNFDFRNFENEILYSVEYDSLSRELFSDNIDKLVNLNVDESWVNNKKKLRVFFYTIFPPKINVTYKICYFNEVNKIIDSILVPNKSEIFFWQEYVDYPEANQKLAFIVTRYDSTTMMSQTSLNYIKSISDSK